MSIIVKNMKMPKTCGECWLYETVRDMVSGEVLFLCKSQDIELRCPFTQKDENCPLEEVTE